MVIGAKLYWDNIKKLSSVQGIRIAEFGGSSSLYLWARTDGLPLTSISPFSLDTSHTVESDFIKPVFLCLLGLHQKALAGIWKNLQATKTRCWNLLLAPNAPQCGFLFPSQNWFQLLFAVTSHLLRCFFLGGRRTSRWRGRGPGNVRPLSWAKVRGS